ncbi:MAG: GyrI-like domain-containing protein [Gammaproteobacteria bacterium]|nr:MAG: GyrI-like domain-containing protein [Gammaproteobacteria bacterium]
MQPRIEAMQARKLVGIRREMSLADNRTAQLWRSFMPRRNEVKNRITNEYISMQVYSETGGQLFSPTTVFEKWAVVEVLSHDAVPDGMESYSLPGGQYAVFIHNGPASAAPKTMQHIFGTWLPDSGYELDSREHFEILPDGYDPLDPQAQEEVWIPIR